MPEQVEYFTQLERKKAKAQATPETLAYIEALEKVAKDAFTLWGQLGTAKQQTSADDLYDSLVCVDFMNEED